MYNSSSSSSASSSSSEHNKCPPLMSPRISFSNDFAESHHIRLHQQQQVMRKQSPATPDFEFSVSSSSNSYSNMSSMTTADELFFKGQFLPFKPSKATTLRDELLVVQEQQGRPPKSSTRWKTLLGLKNKKPPSNNKHFTTGNDE